MANMVVKTKYPNNPKQIMIADSQMLSLGVVVSNEGVTANKEGKKIIKAGTPLSGNLMARNTAFKVASTETKGIGIALHDIDVTLGNQNAALVIFGIVDADKVENDVKTLLSTALDANGIYVTTGSGKNA